MARATSDQTASSRIFNATTHFALQADEISDAFAAAAVKAVRRIQDRIIDRVMATAFLSQPQLIRLVGDEFQREFDALMREIMDAYREYVVAAGRALPRFLNRALRGPEKQTLREQFELPDFPFDETDVDEAGELEDEIEQELFELQETLMLLLLLLMQWNGQTLEDHLMQFSQRQRLMLMQRVGAELAMAGIDLDNLADPSVQSDALKRKVIAAIKRNVAGGRGTQQSRSSVANNVASTVKTNTNTVSNGVIDMLMRQHPELFAGHLWSAILDERTCKRCIALDGTFFPMKDNKPTGPQTPLHPNCRCTRVPVLRQAPGIEARGAVPDVMTFPEWFDQQPERVQLAILGPERLRLYKSGKLTFRDFVQFRRQVPVRVRTLDAIRRMAT